MLYDFVRRHAETERNKNSHYMKMSLLILLFSLIKISTSAQEGNIYRKDFNEHGITLIIERESRGKDQYLKVLDSPNDKLIKSIKIDNGSDLCSVGVSYFGDRKFAIINGRYRFYIVNLSTNILIGPFSATVRGEIEDATSLNLGYFNIFNDGQYLTFASFDFGVCCYNLMDVYNPVEIEMFTRPTKGFKEKYFFLDKRIDNIYNGILSLYEIEKGNIYSREISSELVFQGYKFKTGSNNQVIKEVLEERYLVLFKDTSDSIDNHVIVDFEDGKILDRKIEKELIDSLIDKL